MNTIRTANVTNYRITDILSGVVQNFLISNIFIDTAVHMMSSWKDSISTVIVTPYNFIGFIQWLRILASSLLEFSLSS